MKLERRYIYDDTFHRTNYLYDGFGTSAAVLSEMDLFGNATARYVQGGVVDEPLALLETSAAQYYEADGLGSITSLSSPGATLIQTYTFGSSGNQTASSGSLANPFQYTGREFDRDTQLYYYRARYYDPTEARFVSEDPLRFRAGDNFYDYVSNRLTVLNDPSGLDPASDMAAIVLQVYGYYLCADQIKNDVNHFSREGHPRYAHCMASCRLVKECGTQTAARIAGHAKEADDVYWCIKSGKGPSCNTAYQGSDLHDNAQGRNCPKNKPCEDQCADLRDLPDGPPSWFYRWPFLRH